MYNFDKPTNRFNTSSIKWNVKENELPMWVADMDFETSNEIVSELEKRVKHKIFGYTEIDDDWYTSISNWWEENHHFKIEKEWLMFCTGVVPAISSIVRKITNIAENVVLQTPVYNIFFNSIYNNGRNILESPLIYKDGHYHIDFVDLEQKLANPQTTLMILCNPHNPIGKIWDRNTLAKIGHLCKKHNVVVLSDEIHCDLTDPDKEYVPFASVNEECKNNSITCVAPTKTFNLAGLQSAAIFVPNEVLRHKVNRGINTDEVAEPNCFATIAATAAFSKGKPWLDELKQYIYENKQIVKDFLKENLNQIHLVPSEATYLLWLDCSKVTNDSKDLTSFIKEKTGLFLSNGTQYGTTGKTFIRMNIACPKERLKDGLNRLKEGIKLYERKNSIMPNI